MARALETCTPRQPGVVTVLCVGKIAFLSSVHYGPTSLVLAGALAAWIARPCTVQIQLGYIHLLPKTTQENVREM